MFSTHLLGLLLLALAAVTVYSQELGNQFGDDIRLTKEQQATMEALANPSSLNAPQNAVVRSERNLWPSGRVPYILDGSLSSRARTAIQAAIDTYARETCIRLVQQTSEPDYVRFFSGSGCFSFIGRVSGPQDISIGQGCEFEGIVLHEIFHALGRWHEQSRPDRDTFVRILTQNIQNGRENNFEITNPAFVTTQSVPYDLRSIMHYGARAFSSNGQLTIDPVDPNVSPNDLGQRRELSDRDLQHIQALYCGGSGNTGSWSNWGSWSGCSRTCNTGIRSRTRQCVGGVNCEGSNIQQQQCNTNSCPVPSSWGRWGSWSGCSATCGGGRQQRVRQCVGGGNCVGISTQFRNCGTNDCPQPPTWASWGSWSSCSSTCEGGTRQRTRRCMNGNTCSGVNLHTQTCNTGISCNNGVGSWSTWSGCTAPCGGGLRFRVRLCDSNNCDTQQQTCNTQGCEPMLKGIEHRGCWFLNVRNPNLGLLEGFTPELSDNPFTRTDPKAKCGVAAEMFNFRFFGVTVGYCVSGSNTLFDYQYVESTECQGDRGAYNRNNGFFVMDVYEITDMSAFMDSVPMSLGGGTGSGSGSGARVGTVHSVALILAVMFLGLGTFL